MLISAALAPLFKACAAIGNESAEADGFVPVRKLLARFQTSLKVRPLLVEGMIASTAANAEGLQTPSQWTVLVDSERYPVTEQDVRFESAERPLPPRFRFTIAHELAHSLAFRPTEFGIELIGISPKRASRAELVEAIEKETDRLAPLLLCSEQRLASRLRSLDRPLDIAFLNVLRSDFGVSRYVLLNRLAISLSMASSDVWQRPHVRDVGIVLGERVGNGAGVLRRWPLFTHFPRGIVPRVFSTLKTQDHVPFEVAFDRPLTQAPQRAEELTLSTRAGTAASPEAEQMVVEVSTEHLPNNAGKSFLVLVRDQQVHWAIAEFERIRSTRRSRHDGISGNDKAN